MKHAPHTDLPWSVDNTPSGFEVVNEETMFTVARIPTSQRSMSTRMMETNAAYIVHTANSYPKLVEALRKVAAGKPYAIRATELLSELGEAS